MKFKNTYSLEEKLWPIQIAYWKAQTLLCQQSSIYSWLWFFLWSCMDVRVGLWRGWALKNWCFWTVVLEKTLESPLDCKEIKPVNPKENQSWIYIGRTVAEAEVPILWPPDARNWLTGKHPDAGKGWRQEKKGTTVWNGWMASLTQWTQVWASSGSWWWTGKPGVL